MMRGDQRQLDLLDWLDAQPSYAPQRSRVQPPEPVATTVPEADPETDEDQLDLVELIAGLGRAA